MTWSSSPQGDHGLDAAPDRQPAPAGGFVVGVAYLFPGVVVIGDGDGIVAIGAVPETAEDVLWEPEVSDMGCPLHADRVRASDRASSADGGVSRYSYDLLSFLYLAHRDVLPLGESRNACFRRKQASGKMGAANRPKIQMGLLSAEDTHHGSSAGFLACGSAPAAPSHPALLAGQWHPAAGSPVYSDRIAREFHPISFYPSGEAGH